MNAVSIMAASITFIVMLFVAPLLGCLFGAFSGWVVSLFWDYEVLNFMARIGIDTQGLTLWQTGAALGFLGGFLKTNVGVSKP